MLLPMSHHYSHLLTKPENASVFLHTQHTGAIKLVFYYLEVNQWQDVSPENEKEKKLKNGLVPTPCSPLWKTCTVTCLRSQECFQGDALLKMSPSSSSPSHQQLSSLSFNLQSYNRSYSCHRMCRSTCFLFCPLYAI